MAGDWMMIDLELADKPEVDQIAATLGLDHDAVIGKLVRVWSWFDKQTTDGHARGVTHALLDRITACSGFAEAMAKAEWLERTSAGLRVPKFDRWNGQSAKKRALANRRQSKKRNGEVTPTSRTERDKNVTKEEKRKRTPIAPLTFPAGVDESRWRAFRESRQKLRKPMTDYAEQRALDTLVRLVGEGYDGAKLIDKAIELGWQTFYPRDDCRPGPVQSAATPVVVNLGNCPCGAPATLKVGGRPRCAAHVRGYEGQAAA